MKSTGLLLLLVAVLVTAQDQQWWKTTTFYQVYPRSFKDFDGDGTGDIKGIISKLDHFTETGIGAIWLSPIYKSPMKDFGYDISNFIDIDPIFGTMADFDELISKCKEKGLKLIMDLVPNHSSDQHDWFVKSVSRQDPYTDYYTWRNASGFNAIGAPLPPNNWLSVFGGSAWQWNQARQQFYLHQFHLGQPDLNLRNAAVLKEIKDVMVFWLDKGVDGFRLDAVPHLMEDQTFPDEPLSNDPSFTSNQWGYLQHLYTTDLPELYDVIFELRATLDAKQQELNRPLVMMVEANTDISHTMQYYGNETHPGVHFPFNFQFITNLSNDTRAQDLEDLIKQWMDNMPEGQWPNWVIGNHDRPRIASRVGRGFSLAAVMMGQLLPGTAITYNGEEINMENTWISWEDTQDPQGCGAGEEFYEQYSRDPTRTPFQWSADSMAGFTDGPTTWLPINPNYNEINLEAQKTAEESMYKVYKMLMEARKMKAIQEGQLFTKVVNDNVLAFVREVANPEESVLVIVNTGSETQTANLVGLAKVPSTISFYAGSLESGLTKNDEIQADNVEIPGRGGLVFLYNSANNLVLSAILLICSAFLKFLL